MTFQQFFGDADWIGSAESDLFPLFRKEFSVEKPLANATLRILGFGSFLFFLNGKLGTEDRYLPLNSDFEDREFPADEVLAHRAYVHEYDVTALLQNGNNVLAVLLGNGWYTENYSDKPYGTRKLCYSLSLSYTDGTTHSVVSRADDLYRASYLIKNTFVKLEHHDYTDWQDALLTPDLDGGEWKKAVLAKPVDTHYQLADCPPDRITARLIPVLLCSTEKGALYDAGKNIAGFPVLECLANEPIRVTFFEELTADGLPDPKHTYGQEFSVTGAAGRRVCPQFTWFGFRYFLVEGAARPTEVCVAHTDLAPNSSFESDDDTLNWIYQTYLHTQLCNMHQGIPSDCPHIERRGYTGDGQLTCRAAMKTLPMRDFYRKWMRDISDCQNRLDGHVQYTAPYTRSGGGPGGWGCAIAVLPYEYMKEYGDEGPAREMYPQMLAYLDYLEAHSENGLVTGDKEGVWCLGDWCTPSPILLPPPLINTYFYAKTAEKVLKMARLFDHDGDVPMLEARIEKAKNAIRAAYFDKNSATFLANLQGASAFGLDLGLGNEKTEKSFLEHYTKLEHYDTGIFGTDVVTRLLFEHGHADLAHRLLTAHSPHGFGKWMKDGATTFWEYWGTSRSHSHPMFGAVVAYLFEYVLGIRQNEDSYGYQKITVAPCGTASVRGSMTLPQGAISVVYEKEGDRLRVSLPPNIHATVALPSGETRQVLGPAEVTLGNW